MNLIKTKTEIANYVSEKRKQKSSTGFVPTMGALHEGHASLIEFGLQYHDYIVVSIFVNPTQFNNASDLEKYPRTLDQDTSFLSTYGDSVSIYAPSPQEVYGTQVVSKKYNFNGIENVMEGTHRPGHFDGVGTVLNHLFRQVQPDEAFFGEKDYQQLLIVKKLAEIEKLPLKITGCPIHRQENGLAMSSRNVRLEAQERNKAKAIHEALIQTKKNIENKDIPSLEEEAIAHITAAGFVLDYFEIVEGDTLAKVKDAQETKYIVACVAAFMGEVRLIDNMILKG